MASANYQVPDFETLKQYKSDHYEHMMIPIKSIGSNRYIVAPLEIEGEPPLAQLGSLRGKPSMVIMGSHISEIELGKPYICLIRFSPKKGKPGEHWVVIDSALPAKDFAVHNIVDKALQSWRFNFAKGALKKLYEKFGEYSMMVINHNHDAAQEVMQINEFHWKRLLKEWGNIRKHWHEFRVLSHFGFESKMSNFIIDAYRGAESVGMNRHPFRLAQKEGINPNHLNRFFQAMGVTSIGMEGLESNARDYLDASVEARGATAVEVIEACDGISRAFGVDKDRVESLFYDMVLNARCDYRSTIEMSTISMGKSLRNDYSIARSIAARVQPISEKIQYKDYMGDVKPDGTRFELNQEQKTAIYLALTNKTSIITGGPGTGKTTTAKSAIREILALSPKNRIFLAAPTGKAARRMSDVTGLPCITLHRMMGMVPGTSSMLTSFGENDTLIIDEMSMVDLHLFAGAIRHIADRGRLVLLGDPDQLASVESGDVLNDLGFSRRVPTARLTDVQRQAAKSNIISGAYRVLRGELPNFTDDLHFVHASDSEDILSKVKNLIRDVIPNEYGIAPENIQILAAQKVNACGVSELNREVKDIFNPTGHINREHRQLGQTHYHVGDRVMYLKNRYDRDIQNGECGIVKSLDEENEVMTIDVEGKLVEIPYSYYQEVMHSWAATVHKSQGSEYECVIFVIPREHNRMLTRNLILTAMTRGKKHVFFVGEEDVLKMVLKKNAVPKRRTHLSFMVAESVDENSKSPVLRKMLKKRGHPTRESIFQRRDTFDAVASAPPDEPVAPKNDSVKSTNAEEVPAPVIKPLSKKVMKASEIEVPF